LNAFANARALKETDEPEGMKLVQFAPTAPLPSEVFAFAVGPLETLPGPSAGRAQIATRIITPRGHAAEGRDAALASEAIMARLEAYTGVPYPYDKLDHVALPQAPFGAIENPGLITYRMRQLLLPPQTATPAQQRLVRSIESHEMAHQWFGDYVTQSSWEDVWLSEGFATWLSAKVMDEEEPLARKHLNAAIARERIMASDGNARSHPVRSPINSRSDFSNVYNQFVYQKGAAILGMLENWLGPDTFQRGLWRYLRDHPYSNATTGELAAALRVVSQTDPADVMRDFLDQTGVPEITADVHCEPGTDPRIVFEQTNAVARWNVPVCWRTNTASGCAVVESRRQVEMPAGASCPAWVLPNANGAGYYRTRFNAQQLAALSDRVLNRFTASERLTLVYDLAALRRTNIDWRSVVEKLARDPEPEIAAAAAATLAK
jgi:alanyl aminopeptidase